MAAAVCIGSRMAAHIKRLLLRNAGECVVTVATIDLAFQWVLPGFPGRQGKPALHSLYLFKQLFLNDCRMVVGNNEPFVTVLQAAPRAAHFNDCPPSNDIGADIAFVLQDTENRRTAPAATGA